ncbi:unnamed protein product, partial [Discosporangium mesarthrocarpum]
MLSKTIRERNLSPLPFTTTRLLQHQPRACPGLPVLKYWRHRVLGQPPRILRQPERHTSTSRSWRACGLTMPPILPIMLERRPPGEKERGNNSQTAATAGSIVAAGQVDVSRQIYAKLKALFAKADELLIALPHVGPFLSLVLRVLAVVLVASLLTQVACDIGGKIHTKIIKAKDLRSRLIKVIIGPAAPKSKGYTPGKHMWVREQSRWESHYCGVCGEARWKNLVKCEICGAHACLGCSTKAHRTGLACKTVYSCGVEQAHQRSFPSHKSASRRSPREFPDIGSGINSKAPPMRHQWIRGSILTSERCAACGGSCRTNNGNTPLCQLGYTCSWCHQQVHESCLKKMANTTCSLGRWRKLILPPMAVVVKDHSRATGGRLLMEAAVSKVRSVLPINPNPKDQDQDQDQDQDKPSSPPLPSSTMNITMKS